MTETKRSLDDFAESRPDVTKRVRAAVEEATEFMSQFRADNIVQDAEEIKDALMLPQENEVGRTNVYGPNRV